MSKVHVFPVLLFRFYSVCRRDTWSLSASFTDTFVCTSSPISVVLFYNLLFVLRHVLELLIPGLTDVKYST